MRTFEVDHRAEIEAYVDDVVSGRRPACKWEKLAIRRHLKDLKCNHWRFMFSWEHALRAIKFIELLPHIKGKWAKAQGQARLIQLQPWQKFIVASIFGWIDQESQHRRFTKAFLLIPRKNGKSILAAAIGLYMLTADGEHGAEVYCGATSEKQAWEVFGPAREMAWVRRRFRRYYGVEVQAKKLTAPPVSRFEPIIGTPGDGASPSCAIVDEYHEHANDNLYDTMVSGMGARSQPLALVISTAGSDGTSPCYSMQQDVQEMLEKQGEGLPEQFGIIFTIDEDDDWKSEAALIKANPNFGVSVGAEFLRVEQRTAIKSSRKQNKFKTKHLNVWVGAKEAYLNMVDWHAAAAVDKSISLSMFAGESSCIGGDLSETDDLTAAVHCMRRTIDGKDHYYFWGRYYATEAKVEEIDKYQEWVHDGHLIQCDGETIDYEQVEADIIEDTECVVAESFFYDPSGAAMLAQRLAKRDIEAVKVPQSFTAFTAPMREFRRLLAAGRIHHDGNPVLAWCFSNVVAKETRDGKQMRPVKDARAAKIDGAVAALLAFIGQFRPEEDEDDQDFVDL